MMIVRRFAAIVAVAHVGKDTSAFFVSPAAKVVSTITDNKRWEDNPRWRGEGPLTSPSRGKLCHPISSSSSLRSTSSPSNDDDYDSRHPYRHTLAILTLPRTSADRIANEAILETAMSHTAERLDVVLRCNEYRPSLSELRSYVGEVYSSAWDITLGFDDAKHELSGHLLDVVVYPQNLPNAAPEKWIARRPDLDCVCSHDSVTGWSSLGAAGTGVDHTDVDGNGVGGLYAHVGAINADRKSRGLGLVDALPVEPWPVGADVRNDGHVVFLDDSAEANMKRWKGGDDGGGGAVAGGSGDSSDTEGGGGATVADGSVLIGGPRLRDRSLYDSVAVGGTFDGMHYGHRKLLTLAVSSVQPNTGKLLIGVTKDEMLTSKAYAELIPPLEERVRGVKDFVGHLAPGLKNRVKVVPIDDAYGPPGADPSDAREEGGSRLVWNDFDALVLSHETLPTGKKLNEHRVKKLGLEPLTLLCTRRTEPHGMSSTALRRMRKGLRPEANMI